MGQFERMLQLRERVAPLLQTRPLHSIAHITRRNIAHSAAQGDARQSLALEQRAPSLMPALSAFLPVSLRLSCSLV